MSVVDGTTESTEPPPTASPDASRRRRGPAWVRWGALVAVVLTVGFGAVLGARLGKDPTLVDSPLLGTSAPDRRLPYLERSGDLSLGDLRGKIVVVNFWASWCVACRQEHPALIAAAEAYRASGVRFVGVDFQDRKASATAFLDEMGRGKGYTYLTDPGSRLAVDFGVFGVPETFFIDRDGRIVAKITGASTLPLLAQTLDAMLAGRTPTPATGSGSPQPAPDG